MSSTSQYPTTSIINEVSNTAEGVVHVLSKPVLIRFLILEILTSIFNKIETSIVLN